MKNRTLLTCVLVLLVLAKVPLSIAQGKASIAGTVVDTSGGVVVGAKVLIKSSTGESKSSETDEQGSYKFTDLVPGAYDISVSAPGLKDFTKAGVTVSSGQAERLDVVLEPAGANVSVNVEGQTTSKIETESAQITGNITSQELQKIGLNGRNFTQLITLAPGVSNQTGQDEAKVGVKGSVKYSVNGGRVEYNTFDVDGADVLNPSVNGSQSVLIVTPSLDALSDVQVLTSNYGAQYGRSASGTIVATTKSGGSDFHGDAYYYNRNEFFNSRNYFDRPGKAPLYRKSDLGLTIGGPVFIPGHYNTKKDKTFVFWSEEYRSEREPQEFNHGVPSLAERAGNFSDVCPFAQPSGLGSQVDFKPSQYPDCPTANVDPGTGLGTTFTGNVVPVSPVAQAFLNTGMIPLPNSSGGCNSSINSCYVAAISPQTYWRQELFRLDHNFTPKLKGTFRYIHDEWDTITATPQWGYINNSFPTVQNRFYGPGRSMVFRLSDTITNTLLNDFTFSYTAAHISLIDINGPGADFQRSDADPALQSIGFIFNLTSTNFGNKIPGLVIGGTNAAYGGAGFAVDPGYMPWQFSNPTYSLREELSKVTAKHYLQFGVQGILAQKNEINPPVGSNTGAEQGILYFNNQINAFTGSGGNTFANFLMASPSAPSNISAFVQDSGQAKYYNEYQAWEPYFQDTWHVTPRFTLNLGLRISLFGTYHERNHNAYNWDPSAFNPALSTTMAVDPDSGLLYDLTNPMVPGGHCAVPGNQQIGVLCQPVPLDLNNLDPRLTNGLVRCGVNGVPESCQKDHLFNPAPRVGFAWNPFGGKTSIRAGYGIFFEHGTSNETNTGSLEGSAPLVINMTQYFPKNYSCIGKGSGCSAQGAYPLNVTSIQKKAVWPYAQQWSLSVQRELPWDLLMTVAYTGSKGTHLATELQLNQLQPLSEASNPFGIHDAVTDAVCLSGQSTQVYILQNGSTISQNDPGFVNMKVACSSIGEFTVQPNVFRTFAPGFGQVYFLANIADSRYNAFQATLRRIKGPLTVSAAYSYSHSIDNSSDRTDSTFVNAFDLAANKASSNFDQRHLFNMSFIYSFGLRDLTKLFDWSMEDPTNQVGKPPAKAKAGNPANSNWRNTFLNSWELSGLVTAQSGTPFTIINGGSSTGIAARDNAGVANGTGAGSYPDILGDPKAKVGDFNIPGTFGPLLGNPGAFVAPRGLTFGNAGRNFFNNPGRLNLDISILKNFKLWETSSLEFRIETFNLLNHTQFRIFNPDIGNTSNNTITCYGGPNNSAAGGVNADGSITNCQTGNSFLRPVDAHRPRTMQLGLKWFF